MLRRLSVVVALLAAGCGDDGKCDAGAPAATSDAICEAGKSEACACEDGTMGAQTCADDGAKWGACACSPPAGAGAAGAPTEERPYAYFAKDVCQLAADPEAVCKRIGGALYTKPYGSCSLPADGLLVECVVLGKPSDPLYACCG